MNYANPFRYTDTEGRGHCIETTWPGHSEQEVQEAHNEAVEAMLAEFPEA